MIPSAYPAFSILLVDDEPAFLRSLSIMLARHGLTNTLQCSDSREAMQVIADNPVGLVLLDLTMPHLSGQQLLTQIGEQHPDITVIVVSGMNQVESAVECLRLGAWDYFVKTSDENSMVESIRRAIELQEVRQENRALSQRMLSNRLQQPEAFSAIISRQPRMQTLFQYLESVAPSSQPLMICGESGTGKELLARAVHDLSGRSGPLVTVNVAGLDDHIFADTLFGHTRGAFTGAERNRAGLVAQAAGGTLFLDEIGDLSIASQVKLLRLLQEGEYYPLGADKPERISARVIVATHQDLEKLQAEGNFRRDLYFRLCTHRVDVPPLRERSDDLPLLLEHFLDQAAEELGRTAPGYPPQLLQLLSSYHFPGNVRELRALVFDALSQNQTPILSLERFLRVIDPQQQQSLEDTTAPVQFNDEQPLPTLAQVDQLLVEEAMRRAQHNQSLAARMLGISQPALSKRLKKYRGD